MTAYRMAESSKGRQFLESLQERIYSRLGVPAEELKNGYGEVGVAILEQMLHKRSAFMKPKDIAKLRASMIKRLGRLAHMELPTRFQEPGTYWLMSHLADQIEQAAKDLSISIPIRPLVGTVPTGQVNAMTLRVPSSDEYVIVFESGIFDFANLLSKAVARAIPFVGPHDGMLAFSRQDTDWEKHIAGNLDALRRFQQVILAYLVYGSPSAAPPYIPEEPYGTLPGILRDSSELFVMGHEYGHIVGNHFLTGRTQTGALGIEGLDEIVGSWQQELEADMMALPLMLRALQRKGMDLSMSFWGADFFFSCVDVVERGISLIRTGQEDDRSIGSHPPSQMRRTSVREALRRWFPGEPSDGAIHLGITLERIIDSLWERTRAALRQHYETGGKLAPVWR